MCKPRPSLILTADAACRNCRGSGTFYENHGPGLQEQMDCDCAFQTIADNDQTAWDAVDRGDYEIVSAEGETIFKETD